MRTAVTVVTAIVALAVSFVAASPSSAHPGHGSEPRELPERPAREAAPQRDRSEAPAGFGGGGGGVDHGGPGPSAGGRSITAPHGGILIRTASGFAELLVDPAGNVSLWWLDKGGRVRPSGGALATIVGTGGARPLVLKPVGDRATAIIPKDAAAQTIIVQATVDGRTTTVRAVLPKS